MTLMYNILPIYVLLEVCVSMRNFHLPHGGRHFHYSDMAMQHDHNYQHYDSYSSEEVVMRQHQSSRRTKYHRHLDYSDSKYNYKCKCSCTKCQKKPKPKPCCEDFCAMECTVQNNILVVPYPVPFVVFNQSAPSEFPMPPITPMPTPSSTTTTTTSSTTTTTEEPTTVQTTPPPRKTVAETFSTAPYLDAKSYKRFQIINQKNMRRNMGMANNGLRSPHKFGRLPKYGIVPIPENLALSLMQQIGKNQNHDQLRKRLALEKNLLNYTRLPSAQLREYNTGEALRTLYPL